MPTNVTRGNVEGLIAMTVKVVPQICTSRTTTQQLFLVPGTLVSDVVVSISMPYHVPGIYITNAWIYPKGVLQIHFGNLQAADAMPPAGYYTLILGRPSDGGSLSRVQFS